MITEKRQFIVAWFQEAVAAGKLEEESPSDEDDDSMAFYDVDSPRNESQIVEVIHRETSSRTDWQPRTERNEDFYDPQVQGYHTLLKSGEFPRAEKPENKSRLRASYLINKFRSFDMQILDAGMAGDEDLVEKLVRKQAEREYKDTIKGRSA